LNERARDRAEHKNGRREVGGEIESERKKLGEAGGGSGFREIERWRDTREAARGLDLRE
jgi:hypothetical protein